MFKKSVVQPKHSNIFAERQLKSVHSSFEDQVDMGSYPIEDLLKYLDPDKSYDFWLNVGVSLRFSSFPLEVWEKWSEGSSIDRCQPQGCEYAWEALQPNSTHTLGWLITEAIKSGYELPQAYQRAWIEHSCKIVLKDNLAALHWSELDALPRRKYLVKGLLEEGGMSVIFGASNSGKTFFAIDLACHIALGRPWCNKTVRKGAVVYVAGEGGLGINERLIAFMKHHNLEDLANFYVIPSNVLLCKEESMRDAFMRIIEEIPNVKLVIIDTLARAMGGWR